jgi:hypothetical protein
MPQDWGAALEGVPPRQAAAAPAAVAAAQLFLCSDKCAPDHWPMTAHLPFPAAAEFFRQTNPALDGAALGKAPGGGELRHPPRESLLAVARNSQVKNKISAFNAGGAHGSGPSGAATGGFAKPAAGPIAAAGGGFARPGPPQRRAGAAPSLGAIVEEPAAGPPARRHAAVVSTATALGAAPPRRHAAPAVDTLAVPAAAQLAAPLLPSPATKQQVAEKRHESRFPSIMFQPPQPAAPARAPLPGVTAVLPQAPASQPAAAAAQQQARSPFPLPTVLESVRRASLSPSPQPQVQLEQPRPVPQALAAALAAEAAAAVAAVGAASSPASKPGSGAGSDEEQFVDADSGSGTGPPSQENSAGALGALAGWLSALLATGGWLPADALASLPTRSAPP